MPAVLFLNKVDRADARRDLARGEPNHIGDYRLLESYTPDVSCGGGSTWGGTWIMLNGTGTNYLSLTTTGYLTIKISP